MGPTTGRRSRPPVPQARDRARPPCVGAVLHPGAWGGEPVPQGGAAGAPQPAATEAVAWKKEEEAKNSTAWSASPKWSCAPGAAKTPVPAKSLAWKSTGTARATPPPAAVIENAGDLSGTRLMKLLPPPGARGRPRRPADQWSGRGKELRWVRVGSWGNIFGRNVPPRDPKRTENEGFARARNVSRRPPPTEAAGRVRKRVSIEPARSGANVHQGPAAQRLAEKGPNNL